MKYSFSDKWVLACPETFREEIALHLNNPPGSAGTAQAYAEIFDLSDEEEIRNVLGDFKEEEDTSDKIISTKKFELRKKYSQAWGVYAESVVCCWLLEHGFPIREKDWRPGGKGKPQRGEIDIITQKGNRIIFVEVKARYGKEDDPWKAIDAKKIRRLCRGADIYLKMQKEKYEYQFDVALVTGTPLDLDIEYIEDAFLAPLSTGK